MKRFAVLVASLGLVGAIFGASPAKADFHPACPSGAGASISLTSAGSALNFTGRVVCNGGDSANITSLTLTPQVPAGAASSGPTASCGPCTATAITSTGSVAASPGLYALRMNFNATGGPDGRTFAPNRRTGFAYLGAGAPIAYCTQAGCNGIF